MRLAPSFNGSRPSEARVQADLEKGQLVSVQITSDPGWEVTVGGQPRQQFADALSMMVIDPQCQGNCTINLRWTGGTELRVARIAQFVGFAILLGWTAWRLASTRRRARL